MMSETFVLQTAYIFGQIIGVFVFVFIFVIFPVLGIIYLVKRRRLKRKRILLELISKEQDHTSYKM